MGQEDEFGVKGATHKPDEVEQVPTESSEQSKNSAEEITEKAAEADQGKDEPSQEAEDDTAEGMDEKEDEDADTAKYRWCKCFAEGKHYYIHSDTYETSWEAPNEPYWLWDAETQTKHNLQFPNQEKRSRADALDLDQSNLPAESYTGYNPKIHGNYDPNADYAQYHNRKRVEEAAAADPHATGQPLAADPYQTTMALNRFTGNAQSSHLSSDRHSDGAKSSRQMNAFFDVDAAANAHEGRSLREERRKQSHSKKMVAQFKKKNKERKLEKQKKFLLS